MREIKFRAWLKPTNEMVDVKSIHFESKVIRYNDLKNKQIRCAGFEHIVLMQYTGLKDKNGKEIYEGDIVVVNVKEKNTICEVAWANNVAHFQLWQINTIPNTPTALMLGNYDCEVIGNIYENKDLLEE